MGFITKIETGFGEEKEVYARINNVETSNHGVDSKALVRFFLSKDAFLNGFNYISEKEFSTAIDISKPIWEQFYEYFKTLEEFKDYKDC